jgi:hypothetical protein
MGQVFKTSTDTHPIPGHAIQHDPVPRLHGNDTEDDSSSRSFLEIFHCRGERSRSTLRSRSVSPGFGTAGYSIDLIALKNSDGDSVTNYVDTKLQ